MEYTVVLFDSNDSLAFLSSTYDHSMPAESVFIAQTVDIHGGVEADYYAVTGSDPTEYSRLAIGDDFEYTELGGFDFSIEDAKRELHPLVPFDEESLWIRLQPDGTAAYYDITFETTGGVGDFTGTVKIPCLNPVGSTFYIKLEMVDNYGICRFYPTMYGTYKIPYPNNINVVADTMEVLKARGTVEFFAYYQESVPE
jgi:hypothetical protein